MNPERLMSLIAVRGVTIDHITGGGIPEWTPQDAALACQGLDRRRYAAFAYRWARDDSQRSTLYGSLMTYSIELAERERWPERTKAGARYLDRLVRLAIFEEHHWIVGHAHLWPALIEVSDDVWTRELQRRYEGVRGILDGWCHDAHSHVMRRIRDDVAA